MLVPITTNEITDVCEMSLGRPFSVMYADGEVFTYYWKGEHCYGDKVEVHRRCTRCGRLDCCGVAEVPRET